MAAVTSAGLLVYRRLDRDDGRAGRVEVLLAHPGGPFWRRKDAGAWSVPKGEYTGDEDPLDAARREFAEELGHPAPEGTCRPLGNVRQAGGKQIVAWAVEGDVDPASVVSNTVLVTWPPRSGQMIEIPEIDRVEWFDLARAREKLNPGQVPLLDRLSTLLDRAEDPS
jgi:predicted NUDIX family NTP pyrophosphohydrolase